MTTGAVAGALVACGAPADTCLAIVPKGPGSHDLAGSLGLPFNAYEALEVAAAAQCAPFDLGTLNKRQVRGWLELAASPLRMPESSLSDCYPGC